MVGITTLNGWIDGEEINEIDFSELWRTIQSKFNMDNADFLEMEMDGEIDFLDYNWMSDTMGITEPNRVDRK